MKGKRYQDIFKFTPIFWNSSKDFKKHCRWGNSGFLCCKTQHQLQKYELNCADKLSKDIFHDSNNLAKMMPCGLTKAETIVKNVLPPRSVQDFTDVLKDPAKSINFFFFTAGVSNHKNRKIFPLVVRYFDPFNSVT